MTFRKHFAISPSTFHEPIFFKALSECFSLHRLKVQATWVTSSWVITYHTPYTKRNSGWLLFSAVCHKWALHRQIQRVFILSTVDKHLASFPEGTIASGAPMSIPVLLVFNICSRLLIKGTHMFSLADTAPQKPFSQLTCSPTGSAHA